MDDPKFTGLEKTNLLFKKSLGKPSTNQTRKYYEEPNRSARAEVIADSQLWTSTINAVAPNELSSLTDSSFDDSGIYKMSGSLSGKTSSNGILKRFIKVPLTMVLGAEGVSYESPNSTVSHPLNNAGGTVGSGYGLSGSFNRVSTDIIPFNYDPLGSYLFNLYRRDGTEISYGFGEWFVDNTAGIVTFYDYPSIELEVNEANPPLLSYYKYTGIKGLDGIIATGTTIFDGGIDGSLNDDLAALQISNMCPTDLTTTTFIDALQFGSNCDGSIRLTVNGGGGDSNKTGLVIQKRISGIWRTISKIGC